MKTYSEKYIEHASRNRICNITECDHKALLTWSEVPRMYLTSSKTMTKNAGIEVRVVFRQLTSQTRKESPTQKHMN